jgi:uncharacterized membrane protein
MSTLAFPLILLALILAGGVFGFFYAWSVTVMRGLSLADPASAIAAMQSINASIMTPWFAALFFGSPIASAAAALAAWMAGGRASALWLLAAALVYLVGCFAVTVVVNVPMNNALAALDARTLADPRAAWVGYAGPWTAWNHVRTLANGVALVCVGLALWRWPG